MLGMVSGESHLNLDTTKFREPVPQKIIVPMAPQDTNNTLVTYQTDIFKQSLLHCVRSSGLI